MPVRKNKLPSAELLNRLLAYDPETGILRWKPRVAEMFAGNDFCPACSAKLWNRRFAGKIAGRKRSWYLSVNIFEKQIYAQRLIWKMVHGVDPDEVDHINGDPLDNRLANLRSVTPAENRRNIAPYSNNTSGRTGVRWHRHGRRWEARYSAGHIGYFDSFEEAVAARERAEAENGHRVRERGSDLPLIAG